MWNVRRQSEPSAANVTTTLLLITLMSLVLG